MGRYLGAPAFIVRYLSIIAFSLAIYSGSVYFFAKNRLDLFLKIIATCNLLYCCLTLGVVAYFFQELPALAVVYFIAEILVVTGLAMLELKTAGKLQYDQSK